jgi:serine/threonine protein kinase
MAKYHCPYRAGVEFDLILTTYDVEHPLRVHVKVLETYTFTQSQTMTVAVTSISTLSQTVLDNPLFPLVAFLKLYDPRFLDERMSQDALEPQNTQDAKEVEETYRGWTDEWFHNEVRAYHQLQKLQGHYIPRFFGVTTFDGVSLPAGIQNDVPGILLEFIDGISMEEIDIESTFAVVHPHIGQSAVNCFEKVTSLGVLHGDIRLANLVVRKEDGKVFLLDFALSTFRRDDEMNDEWKEHVRSENEVPTIKDFLQRRQLRDRTPIEPFTFGHKGYAYYNSMIMTSPKGWRDKYFEEIEEFPDVDIQVDENGTTWLYESPNWRVKQGPAAERRQRLYSYGKMGVCQSSIP